MIDELLDYYDNCKRDLPWRKTRDPYCIWISEIMCQQTRVDTVIPYYLRFISRFPSVKDLASAEEDELNKYWQGLGYYSRARNLRKAAIKIEEDYMGTFPQKYEDILSLPGIGDYTASAICAMAFDQPYAAVDGNFFRVFGRFYEDGHDIAKESTKKALREKLIATMPQRSGDFNQAVMDLGATICLPEEPHCTLCPLNKQCQAHKNNTWENYPVSSKKQAIKNVEISIFLIQVNDKIVIRKRKDVGLLASLYEFPNEEGKMSLKALKEKYPGASITKTSKKDHHFTHQTWHIQSYLIMDDTYMPKEGEILASKEEIKEIYSIPRAFNQFFDILGIE